MKRTEATTMTFSNWVNIEGQRICLDELSKDKQESIANSFIYRPLTTISNIEITQTA